jgi:hypothetical protein
MNDGIRDVQSQWIVLLHARLGLVPVQGGKLTMPAPGLRCRSTVPLTRLPHAVYRAGDRRTWILTGVKLVRGVS